MGQLDKAAECVESNLLLLSNANSVMVANKAFYLQQTGLSSDHFVARQVCIVIALPVCQRTMIRLTPVNSLFLGSCEVCK